MLLRPIDGSALVSEDGSEISPAADCGKTGNFKLKFIITDSSEEPTEITDIPLTIIAP